MNSSTAVAILESLPEVLIAYVQACCECDSAANETDAAVHAAMPRAAAKTAVDVIAAAVGVGASAAPSLLLEQALVAIEKASCEGDGSQPKCAIEACVLMLLELAGREELESKIVAARAEATAAVKAAQAKAT
jgi:hypothetical protein